MLSLNCKAGNAMHTYKMHGSFLYAFYTIQYSTMLQNSLLVLKLPVLIAYLMVKLDIVGLTLLSVDLVVVLSLSNNMALNNRLVYNKMYFF